RPTLRCPFLRMRGGTGAVRDSRTPRAFMTRPAYTLLELVLVLALVVILAALVYPSFDAMYSQFKLEGAGDAAKGAMMTARTQAIESGQPYRFAVVPGKGNWRVAPHNAAYWSGGTPPAPEGNARPPKVEEDSLPDGIVFLESEQEGPGSDPQTAL